MNGIASINEALEELRAGKMVILVDDEDRENEGDLVIAGSLVTPEAINFMAVHARGLICLALPSTKVDGLALAPMATRNQAPLNTAFTVSVDAKCVRGQGISAQDRSDTILQMMRADCQAADLNVPGHVFPLRARQGGVLVRAGQTEGGVDLTRLAGLPSGAVICEIMNPDGTMMRLSDLLAYGEEHDLVVITVADLIAHRMQNESLIRRVADVCLPTDYGEFRTVLFENDLDTHVHAALVLGEFRSDEAVLVRVHRADLMTDVFGYRAGRGVNPLDWSMRRIAQEGAGVILYLRTGVDGEQAAQSFHSDRGQAVTKPAAAPAMNFREFGIGAQILSQLGLGKIRILTNNPNLPFHAVKGFGLEITGRVSIGGELDGEPTRGG
jgi:3,4-dihydroxy 2-butanone 4-phosphate synthase/GTP cyclohydrolase II